MKKLNILLALIVLFMIMPLFGCGEDNPVSAIPGERIIYYSELNDTMSCARDTGILSKTLNGDFDFTKSDSIKIEFTYLTNRPWFALDLYKYGNGTWYYYGLYNEPETPCISDSAYHIFSEGFKSDKQKSDKLYLTFLIDSKYWKDTNRYTILKDIKITELK